MMIKNSTFDSGPVLNAFNIVDILCYGGILQFEFDL